jgi:tRNA (guanine-N7-)-methyltransferase
VTGEELLVTIENLPQPQRRDEEHPEDAGHTGRGRRVGERLPREEHVAARMEAHWRKVATRRAVLAGLLVEVARGLTHAPRRVLEVGCGHGHFLTAYAAAHPEDACVGLDYCNERIRRALRKREAARAANLFFVRTEAVEFLETLPTGIDFHRVYVLFPDPWPKKRHAKNRLMSPAFLERLAGRVVAGGELFFRTDAAAYFEQAREVLGASPSWRLRPAGPWPFDRPTVFQMKAPVHESLAAVRV